MIDADYEKQKERVRVVADRWIKPIGLGWWHIDIDYHREHLATTEENRANNWSPTFRVPVKWEYAEAVIHACLPMIEDLSDDELELAFVHELMHIFVNEMREADADGKHEERVATTLAKGFIWIRNQLMEEQMKKEESKKHEAKESKKFEKAEEKSMKKPATKKKGY